MHIPVHIFILSGPARTNAWPLSSVLFQEFGATEPHVKGNGAALPEVKVEPPQTHPLLFPHQHTFKTPNIDKQSLTAAFNLTAAPQASILCNGPEIPRQHHLLRCFVYSMSTALGLDLRIFKLKTRLYFSG